MGGTKGYRSYRGRTSKGKIALAVLLVLIILAAVGFLWLQEYIVYDRDGSFHLELPWKTETPPAEEEVPPEDVEITIQEPEKPKALAAFSASAAPLTQAGWKDAWLGASVMSAPAYNAAAVTLKDSTGHIYFAATGAAAGTVSTAEDTAAALAEVAESSYHSIARMSCFLDPIAARADVEGMGLKNTGGYIFYDGNNGNWLDPSKPAARQYLCTLAAELAQQGFDEILLTDVGYPTVGKLDKIDYNGADRAASIRLFLEELRSALGEYGVAVSIELPPEVITSGADDTAGLVLSDIAPLVDRVYAVTTVDQIPALEAAVSAAGEDTDFVAELTGHSPDVTGSCLILAEESARADWQGRFSGASSAVRLLIGPQGPLCQSGELMEPFIHHIPHTHGQVIPVTTVQRHALKAVAVVGAGLLAGAVVTALPHLLQKFPLDGHGFRMAALPVQLVLLNCKFIAIDLHVSASSSNVKT